MPLFWRYNESYVTRNANEEFRDFREMGPGLFYSAYGKEHIENEIKNQR